MKNIMLLFILVPLIVFTVHVNQVHGATQAEMLLQLTALRAQLAALQSPVKVTAPSTAATGKLQSFKNSDKDIAVSFKYKDKKKLSFEKGFMEDPYDEVYQIQAYKKLTEKERQEKSLVFDKQYAFGVSAQDLATYNKNVGSSQAELDYYDNKYKVKKDFYPGEMESYTVYQLEGWHIIEITKSDRYGGKGGQFRATLVDYTDNQSAVTVGVE